MPAPGDGADNESGTEGYGGGDVGAAGAAGGAGLGNMSQTDSFSKTRPFSGRPNLSRDQYSAEIDANTNPAISVNDPNFTSEWHLAIWLRLIIPVLLRRLWG